MTTWVLNAVSLLAITTGVLMTFLYLHRTSGVAADADTAALKAQMAKDRRLLKTTVGLVALWFVVQYVALIFP